MMILSKAYSSFQYWFDIKAKFNGNRKELNIFTINKLVWSYEFFNRREDLDTEIKKNGFEVGSKYIDFIAKTFPGSLVDQTRLFNLLVIYLPRVQNEYVSIHSKLWKKIAGNNYNSFQQALIKEKILSINHDYTVGFGSKHYNLKVEGNMPFNLEHIEVSDYKEFLQILPKSYLKNELDLNKMTIHRLKI